MPNSSNNPNSPNLQHIIDNHPTRNINLSAFPYENNSPSLHCDPANEAMINTNEPPSNNNLDKDTSNPETVISITSSPRPQQALPANINTKHNSDEHLKKFASNFNGPPIIIIELTNSNSSIGSWHPLKRAKFLCNHFTGINNIKPNSHKKVKVTFDTIIQANTRLNSNLLFKYSLSAYIPSSLIFSYGVIKLDVSFPNDDFWEGLKFDTPVIAFKRISIYKDGILIPTRIVELKFLSPMILKSISIFNVLFAVSPSIRSPSNAINVCVLDTLQNSAAVTQDVVTVKIPNIFSNHATRLKPLNPAACFVSFLISPQTAAAKNGISNGTLKKLWLPKIYPTEMRLLLKNKIMFLLL